MRQDDMAMCGLDCGSCSYREKSNCPGCRVAGGKMFWGECELATCCLAKGLPHCGKCDEFPCERLRAFSFSDSEHGDNGRRIENLRAAP